MNIPSFHFPRITFLKLSEFKRTTHIDFLLKALESTFHMVKWKQHILNDLVFLIHLFDSPPLSQLQQGYFRGHHPTEEQAK